MNPKSNPATHSAIIEAAFSVLSADPAASLAEIAKAAGVGRATLHRYFTGREDLIRTLALQAAKELEQAANSASRNVLSYTAALKKIMQAIIPLGERQWFLAHLDLAAFPDVAAEFDKQQGEFFKAVEAAGKEGLFPASCPTVWAVHAYDHLVYAAWIMVRDGEATPKQATNLAWATFTKGLGKATL